MKFELPEELQYLANSRMEQKHTDALLKDKICIISGATSGVSQPEPGARDSRSSSTSRLRGRFLRSRHSKEERT